MNSLLAFAWPFSETVVERLGWTLVHSLWQFVLVALLSGVAVRAMRRTSSTLRYFVLVTAMIVSVAAPIATWLLMPRDVPTTLASPAANASEQHLGDATDPRTGVRLASDGLLTSDGKRQSPAPDSAASETQPVVLAPESSWLVRIKTAIRPWLAWIVAGWSLGVVVCSARPLLGWHTLRRLKRVGVSPVPDDVFAALHRVSERLGLRRGAVRLLQSTLAQVPIVVGYFRPVILLPVSLVTSIPAAQLEAILAHELAHVRRHDFVVNLLQTLVETLFFYHPAVWWLSRQIRVEREHCCDDLVVKLLDNRVEYGRALVAIEQQRGKREKSVLALGAADGSLLSRVRRIVGSNSERTASAQVERWPAALLGIVLLSMATVLSMTWNLAAKDEQSKVTHPQEVQAVPGNENQAEKAANSGVQVIPPLLEFRIAAQPADSKLGPRVPADFEKREYPSNSVVGRMVAKDKGFVWVAVPEAIPALPVERPLKSQAREALLADTAEHVLAWNGKWTIEDCRVVPDPNGTGKFSIALKLNEAGGAALRTLTKSHLNHPLAIVVNNKIITAPIVRSEIGRDIVITGNFTREYAERIAAALSVRPPAASEIQNKFGTLSGRFIYDGEPPARKDWYSSFAEIDVSQPQQPGPGGRISGVEGVYRDFLKHKIRPKTEDRSLLVGKDGGVANVVVWVVSRGIPWSRPPGEFVPAVIQLKDGNFSPRFAAVTIGQPLLIQNKDPVSLNFAAEFSRALNPSFNVLLPPGTTVHCGTFRAPEPYPASYQSNLAPWANGRVFVHGNPFVAVSQPDGSFTLPNLPTGDWEFQVWHERGGYVQHWPKGRFQQSIKPGDNKLGTIKLKPEHLGQAPVQASASTPPPKNREQIGEVLGKPVYRDEVTDDTLQGIFLKPILAKYQEAHRAAITPTDDEIKFAAEFFDSEHRKRLDAAGGETKIREQMQALEERLARTDLPDDEQQKLESTHRGLRYQLKPPGRLFAEFMLNNWKFQKHLYDEFGGGRILWQQAGQEAFDATRTCLESLEKKGEFKITDAALRAKLFDYWTRSHGGFLTDDQERIRQQFLEPGWIAPGAGKIPSKDK